MIKVKIADGAPRELERGTPVKELAAQISSSLDSPAVAARIDGRLVDMAVPLDNDCALEFITADSDEALNILRHSASHIMAEAVGRLFPDVKFGIGPPIEDGFYYDFDLEQRLSDGDLPKIEEEMRAIIKEDRPFKRHELSREEALKKMQDLGQPYKVELLKDMGKDASVSFYEHGTFLDLCRGPHIDDVARIRAFKLLSVAGSYWRGDERNKMLQRIYATAFFSEEQLAEHLRIIEEAKKRDHRLLGKQLDLFSFNKAGPGFPFYHPRGMVIYNALIDYSRKKHLAHGYQEVKTPMILNEELWHRSGHWEHYKKNMYFTTIDDNQYAVKPMNCPGMLQIYKNSPRSYRELPLRQFEFGLVHRHEKKPRMTPISSASRIRSRMKCSG